MSSTSFSGNWWGLTIRGLVAIVLGVLCFVLTGMALTLLVALVVAYLLVDGIFALIVGLRARSWGIAIAGAIGLVAGALALLYPHITLLILAYIVGAWALLTGILHIWAGISLRREIQGEWLLIVTGVLSILFAGLMFFFPGAGLVTIIWIIGAYAIVIGIAEIVVSLSIRSQQRRLTPTAS